MPHMRINIPKSNKNALASLNENRRSADTQYLLRIATWFIAQTSPFVPALSIQVIENSVKFQLFVNERI